MAVPSKVCAARDGEGGGCAADLRKWGGAIALLTNNNGSQEPTAEERQPNHGKKAMDVFATAAVSTACGFRRV